MFKYLYDIFYFKKNLCKDNISSLFFYFCSEFLFFL